MPPSPTKTLSPPELAKLETAFATDPASDAYRPLAEAYLGMGRFMEAMVVCKKGVKAHPNVADPRVLLARVYAEQGKDKKALEELAGALQVAPNDKGALRLTGSLQLKGGDQSGASNLLKAYQADPADADTLAALKQFKVEPPKAAPVAPVAAPPVLEPVAAAPSVIVNSGATAEVQRPPQNLPPPRPSQAGAQTQGQRKPAPRPSAPRRPSVVEESVSEMTDMPRSRRRGGGGAMVTILLALLFVVGSAAYYGYGQWKGKIAAETKKQLKIAADQLKGDSYDAYQKSAKSSEEALALNPPSDLANVAHAYAAYANVIRWGEHGAGEQAQQAADEHLKEVRALKQDPITHYHSAQALFLFYSGKPAEAVKSINDAIAKVDPTNSRSSLLQLTRGLILMNQGDLEGARENLERAQALASDDPRVYATLGTLHRRRGSDGDALKNFNTALKYTRNTHPEALLGTALLILDQENPAGGYISAAKYVKTLLETEPPPSPRQLAMAHMVRALLVSRVSRDIGAYQSKEFQKQLEDGTGVSADAAKAKVEVAKEEDLGMQDKNNPEAFLVRGKRLLVEENFTGAAEEIRKAIAISGTRAHYHVELARALMKKQGGEKEAEDALRKALVLVPDSPKLMTLLGQALQAQKKIDDALDTYLKAFKDPKSKNGEARLAVGRIYRDEKKEPAKAVEHFERAALDFLGDTLLVAISYDELGLTQEAKGDKSKAKTAFEAALNAEKDYEVPYCHYAKFLAKNGEPKEEIKKFAGEYLRLAAKGECAAAMQPLAQ